MVLAWGCTPVTTRLITGLALLGRPDIGTFTWPSCDRISFAAPCRFQMKLWRPLGDLVHSLATCSKLTSEFIEGGWPHFTLPCPTPNLGWSCPKVTWYLLSYYSFVMVIPRVQFPDCGHLEHWEGPSTRHLSTPFQKRSVKLSKPSTWTWVTALNSFILLVFQIGDKPSTKL